MDIEKLKFPIGKFKVPEFIDRETRAGLIKDIEDLPAILEGVIKNLNTDQLNTPYRPGGWTVRQVVHHLADSHINSYIRFRWTLTEEKPIIKAYFEEKWAELEDAKYGNIEISLILLEAVHIRWSLLLRSLKIEEL